MSAPLNTSWYWCVTLILVVMIANSPAAVARSRTAAQTAGCGPAGPCEAHYVRCPQSARTDFCTISTTASGSKGLASQRAPRRPASSTIWGSWRPEIISTGVSMPAPRMR